MERETGDRLLCDIPLFRKTLAKQFCDYRANMLLTYFTVYLLGLSENPMTSRRHPTLAPRSMEQIVALLRLLTPVTKALTAKASISGLQEAIEALGGVGYLENEETQIMNIARLFRDANGKLHPSIRRNSLLIVYPSLEHLGRHDRRNGNGHGQSA